MFLPHDLAILSLGIYSKQMTAYVHTKMYKKIFIVALDQSKQKTTHVHQIDKTTGIQWNTTQQQKEITTDT